MSEVNTFVDDHISIHYPTDFLLDVQSRYSYSLSKGNLLFAVDIMSRDNWELTKLSLLTPIPAMPVEHDPQAPTHETKKISCRFGDFQGESCWWKLIGPEGNLLMNGADLFLDDGTRTIHVTIRDDNPIDENEVEGLISNISFPGLPNYDNATTLRQTEPTFESEYRVELNYLVSFGSGKAECFNCTYVGEHLSPVQRSAMNELMAIDLDLSIVVLSRVFDYYIRVEYPVLESFLPEEILPIVSSEKDLIPHINLCGIHIHSPRGNGEVPIGLTYDCSWTDNDIGIRVVGTRIEEVGTGHSALE